MTRLTPRLTRHLFIALFLGIGLVRPSLAGDDPAKLVHLLGYIGVDYPATVVNGWVQDAGEYAEQREFAGRVGTLLAALPATPEKASLLQDATALAQLIERKAEGKRVAALTERMRTGLVRAYRIAVAPRTVPDLIQGAKLYVSHCADCHGVDGRGDGPRAKGLDPAPFDFQDRPRQSQRSVYALYNVISLGLDGTAMQGYARSLSEAERWALAFHVANLLASDAERERGAALWVQGGYRARFTGLGAITEASPQQLRSEFGADGERVLMYLRANPETVTGSESPLVHSLRQLDESLAQHRAGNHEAAYAAAVSAYLEGFELVENALVAVRPGFKQEVEREMYAYRTLIKARAPVAEVEAARQRIEVLFGEARRLLEGTTLSPAVAYTSSLVILLREGLEAILLLAVVVAFLIKTGRRSALKYIHVGWVTALALGVATWAAAAYVVEVSGASREVTEGVTALLAAAILLYVGLWLHNKLQAQRWKAFIETRVQSAFERGTLWGIALVAFIAVYREVFETVLFYQALWLQAGHDGQGMVLLGFMSASVALVVLAWLIFRFSVRLPLRLFFGINSVLLYLLAVVFAGKGIAALQEAGKLPVTSINFPTIDVLGVYPNLQALGLQAALILAALIVVVASGRKTG